MREYKFKNSQFFKNNDFNQGQNGSKPANLLFAYSWKVRMSSGNTIAMATESMKSNMNTTLTGGF